MKESEITVTKPAARKRSLLRDTRGLSTVEYAVLLALIVFVCIGVWKKMGKTIHDGVNETEQAIQFNKSPK